MAKKQLNIRIEEELRRKAKVIAAETGRPLEDIIEEIIRKWIKENTKELEKENT